MNRDDFSALGTPPTPETDAEQRLRYAEDLKSRLSALTLGKRLTHPHLTAEDLRKIHEAVLTIEVITTRALCRAGPTR